MDRTNRFFDKILQNFNKVSDKEKKKLFKRLSTLWYSQNIVIENLEEGIIAIDFNGRIQVINKKACFLFSIPRDAEDSELSKYMYNDAGKTILELIEKGDYDTKLLKDDDRILQINILPLGNSGRIIGTLIKAFDFTKNYEISQKLKRVEQLASLTTLAASVAHEIKNPLGSISIYIQLIDKVIKNNIDNECQCYKDFKEYSNIIKEEISRLEDTINSFLFSVRKLKLDIKEVNLNKLILSTIDFLKYEIEKNNVNIDIKFDIDNLILKLDEKYIKQSLINIIQNAIDSIKENYYSKKREIHIKLNIVDNYAVITINDTGIGIKDDMLNKIFEPYYTSKLNGNGLGLTNVARIVEAHNGVLTVESEYRNGSEFTMKFPLHQKNQKFLEADLFNYA